MDVSQNRLTYRIINRSSNLNSQVGRWSSVDQSTKWIQAALTNPTALNYIVTVDSTSPLYSLISENTTVPRLANGALMIGSLGVMREGEIGYLVHPAAWAKGVAPEALTAVIPAYFERYLTEEKLTGHVDSENVRSQRVLIRLGFREVARKPIEMAEQGSRTEIIFELGREDGLRLKESVDS
jgi:RimJ/RimL family protein N-acetyltransferase